MLARERGFSAVEAIFEQPSIQDIVITPTVGSLIGEYFYHLRRELEAKSFRVLDSELLGRPLYLAMDPYGTLSHVFQDMIDDKDSLKVRLRGPSHLVQGLLANPKTRQEAHSYHLELSLHY